MKSVAATPVPGYYRVAAYLAAGPVRSLNAAGETVYRLGSLPVGSISFTGAPPSKFAAELTVDERGWKPIVRRARFYAPAPVRIFMVGRMDRFEAISDYRLSSGGRPELSHQTVDVAGAVLGRAGSQHNDVTYVSGPRPA